ncbi:hypothetical protein EV401DRAFT_1475292 [Pisolithus croceorrhizus]|nr:hypothetical protein EV401DRAFT_1475292 [Pisolithus croceorrhizus]
MHMYRPLSRNDLEESDTSGEEWAVVACIVCTVANLASIYISHPPSPPLPQSLQFLLRSPRLTRQEISKLRHPTQFIGLDRIHRHLSSDAKPFVNKPVLSARVDEASPDKSFFDVDQRTYRTPIGTVFPEHHRIRLTSTASTILQFRAIDYGMEACELRLTLPIHHAGHDDSMGAVGEPSFTIPELPIMLHLSQLDAPFLLDKETITHRTQPRTLRDIAGFTVTDLPTSFSYNFTCRMEDVFTFKLECRSPECYVDWWQDSGNPGISLIQHPSI